MSPGAQGPDELERLWRQAYDEAQARLKLDPFAAACGCCRRVLSPDELTKKCDFELISETEFASRDLANAMKKKTQWADAIASDDLDLSRLGEIEVHWRRSVIEVKDTGTAKGMGAFSRFTLAPGQFVGEYVGEIIDAAAIKTRKAQGWSDAYYFDLGAGFTVDGFRKGNLTRFMNHSDAPNVQATIINHHRIRRVVFHAIVAIEASVELCYDYVKKYWKKHEYI